MRKSRFTEEDVLAALSDVAKGVPVREVGMKIGVSEATIYQWRARYEGLQATGIARLRQLEQENSRLKRISDLQSLHIEVLKAELATSSESKRTLQQSLSSQPQVDRKAFA